MFGLTRKQDKRLRRIEINQDTFNDIARDIANGLSAVGTCLTTIFIQLREIKETMATQDDINKLAAQEAADVQAIADDLTQINSALTATSTAIGDAIAAAKAGGSVDISELENNQAKLDAAATALGTVANAISALVPAQTSPANPPTDPASTETGTTETGTTETGTTETGTTETGTVNDHSDNG